MDIFGGGIVGLKKQEIGQAASFGGAYAATIARAAQLKSVG
jgi:hypothetical protein